MDSSNGNRSGPPIAVSDEAAPVAVTESVEIPMEEDAAEEIAPAATSLTGITDEATDAVTADSDDPDAPETSEPLALDADSVLDDAAAVGEPLTPAPRVDVNQAPAERLREIPGIGPALAERIVAARVDAPFLALDDLTRVQGIGPQSLAGMREHLILEPLGPRPAGPPDEAEPVVIPAHHSGEGDQVDGADEPIFSSVFDETISPPDTLWDGPQGDGEEQTSPTGTAADLPLDDLSATLAAEPLRQSPSDEPRPARKAAPAYEPVRAAEDEGRPVALYFLLGGLTALLLAALLGVGVVWRLNNTITALETRLAQGDQRISEISGEVQTLEQNATDIAGRVDALPPRIAAIEESGTALAGDVEAVTGQVGALGSEVATIGSEVDAMGRTVTGIRSDVESIRGRTDVFDGFLLGIRDLALESNPLPETAITTPQMRLSDAAIRQGEATVLRAENLYANADFEVVLIDGSGSETLIDTVRTDESGRAEYELRQIDTTNLSPGSYALALFPPGGATAVARAPLVVSGSN